jgi:hypothetical protein
VVEEGGDVNIINQVLLPLDWHHDLMVESQPIHQMLTSLNDKTSSLMAAMGMQEPCRVKKYKI